MWYRVSTWRNTVERAEYCRPVQEKAIYLPAFSCLTNVVSHPSFQYIHCVHIPGAICIALEGYCPDPRFFLQYTCTNNLQEGLGPPYQECDAMATPVTPVGVQLCHSRSDTQPNCENQLQLYSFVSVYCGVGMGENIGGYARASCLLDINIVHCYQKRSACRNSFPMDIILLILGNFRAFDLVRPQ